jgi:hypothetical protein
LDTALIDTFPEMRQFFEMGIDSRFAMMSRIDSVFAEGDTTTGRTLLEDTALMTPRPAMNAAGVEIVDDASVNKVIGNYKKFYELYLKYLDSSMTEDDTTLLDSLAGLCTGRNGDGVIMARALYHLVIDGSRVFDNICDESDEETIGEEMPGEESQGRFGQNNEQPISSLTLADQSYILHPNPNNGNFTIRQIISDSNPLEIEILNAIGASIYKERIEFVNKHATFKLNNLSTGNYLLKLTDSKNNRYTIKFTVLQ